MQRFQSLARVSKHVIQHQQIRNASGGVIPTFSKRWAEITRSQSNIDTPEDPPTSPLPESHEAGEGTSDFSNWVNNHEDVSLTQALSGFAFMSSIVYGIYYMSKVDRETKIPVFTLRELPTVDSDFPTLVKRTDK